MNIAYSSSEYYFKPTYISIYSLLLNSSEKHNIFLLSSGVSNASKEKLEKLVVEFGSTLQVIEVRDFLESKALKFKLPVMRGNYSTYARIFLADILPGAEDILLIDSDTLVVGDIYEIKKYQSNNPIMLACRDYVISNKYSLHEDDELRFSEYFNMGVLYINLRRWREEKLTEYLEINIDQAKVLKIADQSILNKYLIKSIEKLNLKFNFYTYFHYKFDYYFYKVQNNSTDFLSQSEFYDSRENPIIMHFIGAWYERPWYKNNICPFKIEYLKYWKSCFDVKELLEKPKLRLKNNIYDTISQFIFKYFGLKAYFLFRYRLIQSMKGII